MRSLSAKWFLSFLAVMVTGLVLLGIASYMVALNHYQDFTESSMLARADSYAKVWGYDQSRETWERISKIEKESGWDIYLFSQRGELLLSPGDASATLQHARKWSKESTTAGVQRVATPSGQELILVKSWLHHEEDVTGSLILAAKSPEMKTAQDSFQSMLLLAGVGALLVASSVSLVLSRRIVHPILQIRQAAEKIVQGDYDIRVDVTGNDELASLGRGMNQLADSLAYYRSTRREFLSDVAHELRTPLTYLKGYAAILEQQDLSEEETNKLTKIIRDQANRLDRLVGDIVTLSRLDEGKLELSLGRVEVGRLLSKVVEEMQPQAKKLGLTLRLIGSEEKLFCLLDPDRFSQIFTNLLDNAFRFSDKGQEVVVSLTRKHHQAQITVVDQGVGMAQEELERIWDRFYRVEKSRSRRHGGSGLGLSIVKHLTERQKGRIQVDSNFGAGTTFTLHFPIDEPLQ